MYKHHVQGRITRSQETSSRKKPSHWITITKNIIIIILILGFDTICTSATPIVVKTMADLRALNVSNGSVYTNDTVVLLVDYYAPTVFPHVYGYSTHGRGGGFFRWRAGISDADDGGRFIQPTTYGTNGGRWERMLNGTVPNVKMWGAIGDGNANGIEWIAIQNAINACTFSWASELLIPTGTYVVSNTIVFPSQLHIRGEGQGNNTMIGMQAGYQKDIFRTSYANSALKGGLYNPGLGVPFLKNSAGEGVDYDHGLVFENLYIYFTDSGASTNAALVVCLPGEANTIRNIMTANGGYGIRCLGIGAPGLKVLNCSLFATTIAGINIEPLYLANGSKAGVSGGPVTLTGISGDSKQEEKAASNSLVAIEDCAPIVSIYDFKAEGEFGSGLFRYRQPNANDYLTSLGALSIHSGTWNVDIDFGNSDDFVVLSNNASDSGKTASVNIGGGIQLNGVRNLIRDTVSGRNVESDTQVYAGGAQISPRQPIHYLGSKFESAPYLYNPSRLIIGQTAYSYLYATNSGWYRVMIPLSMGIAHIAGKLVISSYGYESTEIQIDVTQYSGSPYLNVTRASYGSSTPIVTQARAFRYWDYATSGEKAGVDVYVGNPKTSAYREVHKRITFALDLNGQEVFDYGQIQLVGIPQPVSATLPTNAVTTVVNTYR